MASSHSINSSGVFGTAYMSVCSNHGSRAREEVTSLYP